MVFQVLGNVIRFDLSWLGELVSAFLEYRGKKGKEVYSRQLQEKVELTGYKVIHKAKKDIEFFFELFNDTYLLVKKSKDSYSAEIVEKKRACFSEKIEEKVDLKKEQFSIDKTDCVFEPLLEELQEIQNVEIKGNSSEAGIVFVSTLIDETASKMDAAKALMAQRVKRLKGHVEGIMKISANEQYQANKFEEKQLEIEKRLDKAQEKDKKIKERLSSLFQKLDNCSGPLTKKEHLLISKIEEIKLYLKEKSV